MDTYWAWLTQKETILKNWVMFSKVKKRKIRRNKFEHIKDWYKSSGWYRFYEIIIEWFEIYVFRFLKNRKVIRLWMVIWDEFGDNDDNIFLCKNKYKDDDTKSGTMIFIFTYFTYSSLWGYIYTTICFFFRNIVW